MKTTDLLITPRDPVILRDGRPFGESGVPQAGTFFWPRPGTVIGMVRNYTGTLRRPDFFMADDYADRIVEIKKVAMTWFLPAIGGNGKKTVCLPAPADAVTFSEKGDKDGKRLEVKAVLPLLPDKDEGTDLFKWPGWQYPWIDDKRKPEKNAPVFWHWRQMKQWLISNQAGIKISRGELGITHPQTEERTHVCIDPATGSAAESRLFTTMGVRFDSDVHIAARIELSDTDRMPSNDIATLGGDRRPVFISWRDDQVDWPMLPEEIGNANGFRLVLASPGIFSGGWVPEWLKESLAENTYVNVPDTDIRLRLCSACIPRWQPCHGWDMTVGKKTATNQRAGGPKPLRKMVPAGAVYFVEAEPGTDMKAAAKTLWNLSLCEEKQDQRDGFGRILVGNWNTRINS